MPYPSSGCQTCKIRRIKCDETKPACLRCIKARRICVAKSVDKQACFSIHDESRYASGETKRPRGPRSSLTLVRLQLDLRTRALGYFMQYHIITPPEVPTISIGLYEHVPAWKKSGPVCQMVDLALSSIALMVFSRIQHHPDAAMEASSTYYSLLRVAQHRIAQLGVPTLNQRDIDACLIAIFLMGRYEGVAYEPNDIELDDGSLLSLSSWSHHDGAMAILKAWNDYPSRHPATDIMKHSRRGLLRSHILRHLPLPSWILDGERFGEHDLDLDYDRILVRMTNLHHVAVTLQRKGWPHIAMAEKLNDKARVLDGELQEWAAGFPKTWSYRQHNLPDTLSRKHFYSSTIYSFSKPGHAAVSCQYFSARMLVSSTRLKALEACGRIPTVGSTYEQQRAGCIRQLNDMANNLACSLPSCLERFKMTDNPNSAAYQPSITLNMNEEIQPPIASLVMWPMCLGSNLLGVDAEKRSWFRSELASLGRITGEGLLSCAESKLFDLYVI